MTSIKSVYRLIPDEDMQLPSGHTLRVACIHGLGYFVEIKIYDAPPVPQAARGGDSSGDGKATDAMSLDLARWVIRAWIDGRVVNWTEPYQSKAIRDAETRAHPDHGGSIAALGLVKMAKQVILGRSDA